MDNTYIIEKDNIVDALEDIQSFETMMSNFMEKHPKYSYQIDIKEATDSKWIVELNVKKDESENHKIT
jgi:hypothetical protein